MSVIGNAELVKSEVSWDNIDDADLTAEQVADLALDMVDNIFSPRTLMLSLVLALVMAFSCMSVIGNAALVKSEVSWDNIDDADLTAEQVADLALDLVDNVF